MKVDKRINRYSSKRTRRKKMRAWIESLAPVVSDKPLIRFGPNGDGGYLIPDDLENIEACFSPGVSFVSGFEKSCASLGMKVFLADKSVSKPADEDELFVFTPKFIGATSDDDFMTLDEWVNNSLPNSDSKSDLILQMDIEGYEYEVLLSTSQALMNRFRIIVIEFHLLDDFWGEPFYMLGSRAFAKLLETHACVHIHPNNCRRALKKGGLIIPPVMEFTFARKDIVSGNGYQRQFPHPLDFKNTSNRDIVLPKCWYRRG